jgi:hypothetical protein
MRSFDGDRIHAHTHYLNPNIIGIFVTMKLDQLTYSLLPIQNIWYWLV